MKRLFFSSGLAVLALSLAACQSGAEDANVPGGSSTDPFGGIAADDVIHLIGNEPFWGGDVTGETLEWTSPEDPDGITIAVERFAGRNGLSYSGELKGRDFVMAVTPGECSDTMSDRTYPYTVTLEWGDESRNGCAWTDSQPFTGPQMP